MARQTFNIGPFEQVNFTEVLWTAPGGHLLNAAFFDDGVAKYLGRFRLSRFSGSNSIIGIQTADDSSFTAGQDLSAQFESQGTVTVESGGRTLIIQFPLPDLTEQYEWVLTGNDDPIKVFADAYISGDDVVVTFDDNAAIAPAFADSTGDDQTWTAGTAIPDLTVPEPTGSPTPTLAVVGSLPAGLAFNTTTRVISGTPTALGSGTITIRATNSEGTADWTVDYTISAFTPTEQAIVLGGSLLIDGTQSVYAPSTNDLESALAEGGSSLVNVQSVTLYANGQVNIVLGGGTDAFSSRVLVQEDGFTVSAPGLASVDFDGPNHADNMFADPTEPYSWTPNNATALGTFFDALALATVVTLTIRDGILAVTLVGQPLRAQATLSRGVLQVGGLVGQPLRAQATISRGVLQVGSNLDGQPLRAQATLSRGVLLVGTAETSQPHSLTATPENLTNLIEWETQARDGGSVTGYKVEIAIPRTNQFQVPAGEEGPRGPQGPASPSFQLDFPICLVGDEAIKAPLDATPDGLPTQDGQSIGFFLSTERIWIPARAIVDLLQPEQMDIDRVRGITQLYRFVTNPPFLIREMADIPGTDQADILTLDKVVPEDITGLEMILLQPTGLASTVGPGTAFTRGGMPFSSLWDDIYDADLGTWELDTGPGAAEFAGSRTDQGHIYVRVGLVRQGGNINYQQVAMVMLTENGHEPAALVGFFSIKDNTTGGSPTLDLPMVIGDTTPEIRRIIGPTVIQGTFYFIQAHATSGELPYTWSILVNPLGLIIDPATGYISGNIPLSQNTGLYSTSIQVEDADGDTDTETFTTIVERDTTQLYIAPIQNQDIEAGGFVNIPYFVTGGIPPYTPSLTGLAGLPVTINSNRVSGIIPDNGQWEGTTNITVHIEDANGTMVSESFVLDVLESTTDYSPTVTPIPDIGVIGGESIFIRARVTGGNAPFTWSLTLNPFGNAVGINTFSGIIFGLIADTVADGSYQMTVRVTDDDGDTDDEIFFVTVGSIVAPTQLELLFIPNFYRNQGGSINFQARVTGGDSPFTWTLPLNPLFLSIDRESGVVTRTIPANQPTGPYLIEIRVVDFNDVIAERTFTITIGSQTQDTSPVIGPIDDFDQRQGTSISPIQAILTDGNAPFIWSFVFQYNPLNLRISTAGRITGDIPAAQATGPYATRIRVTDADGDRDDEVFVIDVTSEDTEENMIDLIIGAIGDFSVQQGSDVRFQAIAAGGTRPYTWSFVPQFNPLQLSIDPITGYITKTPIPADQATGLFYSTRIQVRDANNDIDIENFVVTVVEEDEMVDPVDPITIPGLTLPVINLIADFAVEQPDTVDLLPRVTGGDSPYEWTFFANPLELFINESTGRITGRISYYRTPGAYLMGVQVEDNNNNRDTETFFITVAATFLVPVIAAIPDFDVRQGSQVRYQPIVNGGLAPFTWTLPTNPLGLSIDSSTGRITGTIPAGQATGDYATTVRVEDSPFLEGIFVDFPEIDTETFVIRVAGGDTIPLITAIGDFSLIQSSTVNLIARVNGGNSPYTWTLPLNPLGLSIDGSTSRITGTIPAAQATGDYATTVRVEDSDGDTDDEIFVIDVETNRPRIDPIRPRRYVRGDKHSYCPTSREGRYSALHLGVRCQSTRFIL